MCEGGWKEKRGIRGQTKRNEIVEARRGRFLDEGQLLLSPNVPRLIKNVTPSLVLCDIFEELKFVLNVKEAFDESVGSAPLRSRSAVRGRRDSHFRKQC